MSVCVYGRINKKCINEDLLEKIITEYFSFSDNVVRLMNKESVTYEGINDCNKIIVTFVNEKKPPYNVYDSAIYDGEYEYMQLIIFDIKKEESYIDEYKKIIDFCIYIRDKIEGDILVTSDVYDEICLLKEKKIIWSSDYLSDKFNKSKI